eukprot:CAMPEP_0197076384 /NCGR_PEP_ID=MMETSP1384-20130603/212088_1 /TAXON_ID=29189 /ORGANISM="Ammonia sp." /LENGTH=375 /DNA_ID=CAMNT_0042515237 /DNA_START=1 /DNA_END=1124 /DNA_ORIENTATION=-
MLRGTHNDDIKINHESASSTSLFDIYESEQFLFLDTKGTQNSDNDQSTQQLTKQIIQQCYLKGVRHLKIIWCIASDATRMKSEFQHIVQFLLSINKHAFRNSCMLLSKKVNNANIQGIIAAIHKYSTVHKVPFNEANLRRNHFNVNCVDVSLQSSISMSTAVDASLQSSENDQLFHKLLQNAFNNDRRQINEKGYYTIEEYRNLIRSTLQTLQSVDIKFEIEKCINCAEIGDPRFVSTNCHYQKVYTHANTVTHNFHTGKKEARKAGNYQRVHGQKALKHEGEYKLEAVNTSLDGVARNELHSNPDENELNMIQIWHYFQVHPPQIAYKKMWSCCKQENKFAVGCYEYCMECNQHYRTTDGCIAIESEKAEYFCS